MGRSLDDVRAVVLTHGDTDHIGFAERLRRERGTPVYVHELDAARARGEVGKPMSGWGPVKLGPLAGFLAYTARKGGLRIKPLTEVVTFRDGATLAVPGAPRVIHLPGHTPGSVALHVPVRRRRLHGRRLHDSKRATGEAGPGRRPSPWIRHWRPPRSRGWTASGPPGSCPVMASPGRAVSPRRSGDPGRGLRRGGRARSEIQDEPKRLVETRDRLGIQPTDLRAEQDRWERGEFDRISRTHPWASRPLGH